MKKLIATLFAGAALLFGSSLMAQDETRAVTEAAQTDTTVVAEEQTEEIALAVAPAEEKVVRKSFHQALKEKFIQGGAGWMTPILLVLIIGLALVFERIIYLNMAQTNTFSAGRGSTAGGVGSLSGHRSCTGVGGTAFIKISSGECKRGDGPLRGGRGSQVCGDGVCLLSAECTVRTVR